MIKQAKKTKVIQVFEWESLHVGRNGFSERHFESLVMWQDNRSDTFFKVGHRKITFTQWVGVLQVGSLVIEILPKIDDARYDNTKDRKKSVMRWKNALIDMLAKTRRMNLRLSDDTSLSMRNQNLMDIYFHTFLNETEKLIHQGLVKKYRRDEQNRTALKGKFVFQKHIAKNFIHKERFYTEASCYDQKNDWNEVLLAALKVTSVRTQSGLNRSRSKNLELHFPDWPPRRFDQHFFDRLHYDRKTDGYKKAINLAKLILLQLNPQIASGKEEVFAILFDMNKLWEEWLLETYKRSYCGTQIKVLGKKRKNLWMSKSNGNKIIESDILIEIEDDDGEKRVIVLDAKWKRAEAKPADDDIKQMFVYNLLWGSKEAWLIYPDTGRTQCQGEFQYTRAGFLGMHFVELFDNSGRLVKELKLPKKQNL